MNSLIFYNYRLYTFFVNKNNNLFFFSPPPPSLESDLPCSDFKFSIFQFFNFYFFSEIDGVLCTGMYFDGARWDYENKCVCDPRPAENFTLLPVTHLIPVPGTKI